MDEECTICRHLASDPDVHEPSLYLGFALAITYISGAVDWDFGNDDGPLCQKHIDAIVPILERLDT